MTPDINRCDHDMQPLESDTVDVGPQSQWCAKCGLILAVVTDSVDNAVIPVQSPEVPTTRHGNVAQEPEVP